MPILSLTKKTRRQGLQTHANVMRLLPEIRDAEMQYLDMRDWYINQVARLAQFDEALAQAKATGDKAAQGEFGRKVRGIQNNLEDARARVKMLSEEAYAVAFMFAAERMLTPEAKRAVNEAAERLIGRGIQEIARGAGSPPMTEKRP